MVAEAERARSRSAFGLGPCAFGDVRTVSRALTVASSPLSSIVPYFVFGNTVKMSSDKQQLVAMGFEEARIDCELNIQRMLR